MKSSLTTLHAHFCLLVLSAMVVFLLPAATYADASPVILLQDGFEGSDWDAQWDASGVTKWYRDSSPKHAGSYCASARNSYEGVITSDNLDASDAVSITVDFWFQKDDIEPTELTLYYYNGTQYNLITELDARGSDDVWLHYTHTITDSQYFKSNFRIQLDGYNLDSYENIWIDDVLITKTTPAVDDTASPAPDPMTWATVPHATGSTSVSMTAATASDTSGVEYYFACVAGGGHDSGWLSSNTYIDTGLAPDTDYSYQLKARDKSPNANETAWSASETARTLSATGGCTKNILLTGYWPPSNEMLRKFSNNPSQNPAGWQGQNWEGRGYDIYACFPEFPGGTSSNPKGNGDFEIDYQDVSSDFWRITDQIHPIAILSFGQGAGPWEIEYNARNLSSWSNDYLAPTQPTPYPPDSSASVGYVRNSTLPVQDIADAINNSGLGINAWVDSSGNPGAFLCEYMAYHDAWYQSLHNTIDDPYQCLAAGFTHVAAGLSVTNLTAATDIALRTTIEYLDSQLYPHYTMTIDIIGNGTVQLNPDLEYYEPNTPVILTAVPNTAATFTGWTGDVSSAENPINIIMDSDKYITASFSGGFNPVTILGSFVSGTAHTAEAGSNRALIFTAHTEDDNTDMNLTSVTYGGQPMTKVIERNVGSTDYRSYVVAYVLSEDGISKATGSNFVVTWAQTPFRTPAYSSVFLGNVNQTALTGATAANGGTTATISTTALATANGDMVILAGTNGNTGSYTANNGFTEALELAPYSADGVVGYKAAAGSPETPSLTHSYANRQVIIGLVVKGQ